MAKKYVDLQYSKYMKEFIEKQNRSNSTVIFFDGPDRYQAVKYKVTESGLYMPDLLEYEDLEGNWNYSIYGSLDLPIIGSPDKLSIMLWTSISERDYDFICPHFESSKSSKASDFYFGKLSNSIPLYENTLDMKVRVHPRIKGKEAKFIILDVDHQLAVDIKNGISLEKANSIIAAVKLIEQMDREIFEGLRERGMAMVATREMFNVGSSDGTFKFFPTPESTQVVIH
jgi:hypothetical protein